MLIFCIIILVAGSISGITALIFVIKELTDDEEDFLLIKAFVFGALTILLLGVGIPCTILGPQEYNTVIHTVQTLDANNEAFIVGKSSDMNRVGTLRTYYWIKYSDTNEPQTLSITQDKIVFTDDVEPSLRQIKQAWDWTGNGVMKLYLPTNTVFKIF